MVVCKKKFGTTGNFHLSGSLFGIIWQSLLMPNSDPRDANLCPYLTAIIFYTTEDKAIDSIKSEQLSNDDK